MTLYSAVWRLPRCARNDKLIRDSLVIASSRLKKHAVICSGTPDISSSKNTIHNRQHIRAGIDQLPGIVGCNTANGGNRQ